MSRDPKVIDPPDYHMAKAAEQCGVHAGVFACPACNEYYNDYGGMRVVECLKCNFRFPTDWWPIYAKGVDDGRRIAASGVELTGGMKVRMANPYYRAGFNTPDGLGFETRSTHDWRALTAGWEPKICEAYGLCSEICERCGKVKDESRRRRSGECARCEAETECRHRCSMMNDECLAGVNFNSLVAGKLNVGQSLPCYYVPGTVPIHCYKYERMSLEEVQAKDAELANHLAKHMLAFAVISRVKQEHKGQSWTGVEECPACHGKLHLSHAGYNGHVHGKCETEGCLSWME